MPQYLTRNVLKWHLSHLDDLLFWDTYTAEIPAVFSYFATTSREMSLQLLRKRIQGDTESFSEYYTSIIDLCHKYDTHMTDLQIVDRLKAGIKIALYEKLQDEDFLATQDLFHCIQRFKLDNAVLDAGKSVAVVISFTSIPSCNIPKTYNQPKYYQHRSPADSPYLMSIPYSAQSCGNTSSSPLLPLYLSLRSR